MGSGNSKTIQTHKDGIAAVIKTQFKELKPRSEQVRLLKILKKLAPSVIKDESWLQEYVAMVDENLSKDQGKGKGKQKSDDADDEYDVYSAQDILDYLPSYMDDKEVGYSKLHAALKKKKTQTPKRKTTKKTPAKKSKK